MSSKVILTNEDLATGAMPIEWNSLSASRMEDEIRVHRWLQCIHYSLCLNYSSGKHWEGWSCHWCPLNRSGDRGRSQPKPQKQV